jgi:CHRD domain
MSVVTGKPNAAALRRTTRNRDQEGKMKERTLALIGLVAAGIAALALAGLAGAAGGNKLDAQLKGSNERPAAPASNRGSVEITLKAARVCWEFSITKIDGKPAAAHIHKGRPGVAGPVYVPLGTTFKRQGCTTASSSKIKAIRANPGRFYVNVHNAKHLGGAMRGQLRMHA